MEAKNKKETRANYRVFLIVAASTAILLVSPVLVLLVIGYLADNIFHTAPLYMFLGIGIGFVGGIMNVFKMVQVFQKKKVKNQ